MAISPSTDPDGDELAFRWWVYREVGTYEQQISIPEPSAATTSLTVPANAAGRQIHVILEVRDCSAIVPLYDYRRIVLDADN